MSDDDEPTYALLLPAGEVPEGGVITKRTGDTKYKLVTKITFTRPMPDVIATEGVKLMLKVDEPTHAVYSIPCDTLVLWHVSIKRLESWVYRQVNGPPA